MAGAAKTARKFEPISGIAALLNLIYEVKFSRHVPLSVILLSAVYAVYRSAHWFRAAFHLPELIAWPTAVFVELLVLGCGALVFITYRAAFLAELRKEDESIARVGAYASLGLLAVALAALIGIAWADAWMVTENGQASLIMTLVQVGQSGMILIFVVTALLDARTDLRAEWDAHKRGLCRWCEQPISANNRARHEASCAQRPQQNPAQP